MFVRFQPVSGASQTRVPFCFGSVSLPLSYT